jgi:hypothetical protein
MLYQEKSGNPDFYQIEPQVRRKNANQCLIDQLCQIGLCVVAEKRVKNVKKVIRRLLLPYTKKEISGGTPFVFTIRQHQPKCCKRQVKNQVLGM